MFFFLLLSRFSGTSVITICFSSIFSLFFRLNSIFGLAPLSFLRRELPTIPHRGSVALTLSISPANDTFAVFLFLYSDELEKKERRESVVRLIAIVA